MSSLRRTVALLLVVAYVFVATVGAGWVICVESDGQVVLERLAAGCCEDEPREPECEGCDDTPLLETLFASNTAGESLPDMLPPLRVGSLQSWSVADVAIRTSVLPPPPRPPPQTAHLAVTVLRL